MEKTLLITGGTGFVGQHLISRSTNWSLHATYLTTPPTETFSATWHQCDLRNDQQVRKLIGTIHPEVIIHTACSDRSPDNIDSIVPAARHIAQAIRGSSRRLIFLSTDMVFDGEEAPYHEQSLPKPISDYGRAKLEAERIVAAFEPLAVIVRTSLIYGIDPVDRPSRWLLDGLNQGRTVGLFTDEIRCPIWASSLCESLLELARGDYSGVLNIAGPEPLTRWEFGLGILPLHKKIPNQWIVPSTRAEAGLRRPRDLTLNIEKAKNSLMTPLLSVTEVCHHLSSSDFTRDNPTPERAC